MLRTSFRPILRSTATSARTYSTAPVIAKLPTRLLFSGAVLTIAGLILLQDESRTVCCIYEERMIAKIWII